MTGARPAQGAATTTDDGLVRTHERASLRAFGMTSARPAQGTATATGDGLVRTHERTSLRAFGMTGARPAQGTATTTGDGLVRTHECTSLRAGEGSLRPLTQRTYKYHANEHPLQAAALVAARKL